MLLFLYGLILLTVIALVLIRWRWPHEGLGWFISAPAGMLLWLVVLVARPPGPIEVPWLLVSLDDWARAWGLMGEWSPVRWAMLLVGLTWMAAALLAEAPYAENPDSRTRTQGWLIWWPGVAASLWALTPKSPSGLWWAWVLGDLIALALALHLWPDQETRLAWQWHTVARSVSWLGAMYWGLQVADAPLHQPVEDGLLRGLLLTLVLWRLLWAAPVFSTSRKDFWRRGGRLLPLWLVAGSTLPALHGLASWPPGGEPGWMLGLFLFLGFVAAWVGLARWVGAPTRLAGLTGLVALWAWPALMAAWFGLAQTALFWASLPWLLGAAVALFRLPDKRLLPLWAALGLALTLWPWTPGQAGSALWGQAPWWVGLWAALVLAPSLPLLVSRSAFQGRHLDEYPRWVRVFYPLGLGVLVVGLWRWGWSLPAPQGLPTWALWLPGPLLVITAIILGLALERGLRQFHVSEQTLQRPLRYFAGQGIALYRGLVTGVESLLYFLSVVFEGESGLMWALAFLAAASLFFFQFQ